jgi:hypothetical protein
MPDPATNESPATDASLRWSPAKPFRGKRGKGDSRRIAIDAGAQWIRGIACDRAAGRITVTKVADERWEDDGVRPDVRALLGLPGAPAIVALPRESVLVGRIELPSDDEAELRSMAHIALLRDYTIEGVECTGDFQRSAVAEQTTAVIAAGAARSRVQEACARVGAPAVRVSARVLGMLALVRTSDTLASGTTLALDFTPGSLECALVREGELLHSRGAGMAPVPGEQAVSAALVEFRRLMAALRTSIPGLALDRIVIAGERSLVASLAPQVASIAACSATRLDAHPRIAFASPDVRERACASCLPLAGLLLEDEHAVEHAGNAINLLHPTPQIDVAARARERMLMVVGAVVIAAIAGYTLGIRSWRTLEERHDDLLSKARNAEPVRLRFQRDELRARHIDAYKTVVPDWLAHFDALRRFAPDPSSVVLDSLTVQIDGTDIDYTEGGKMVAKPELRFVLDGEAKDRATADALRDTLVKEKGYTIGSSGADARGGRRLPYPFAYTLRTPNLTPPDPAKPSDAKGAQP